MNLIDRAKQDWQKFTSSASGFGRTLTLIAPNTTEIEIIGLATKHHLGIDEDGNAISTKQVHVSFSEKLATDLSYPIRNANGEVDIIGHTIKTNNANGLEITYVVQEAFPDETIGVIVCILGETNY